MGATMLFHSRNWTISAGLLRGHGTNLSDNISTTVPTVQSIITEAMGPIPFFDTYFSLPRFAVETTLACMATSLNFLTLVAMRSARYHRSKAVYNTLFINLSTANVLTCILSWLCNNVLFLFNKPIWDMVYETFNICKLFVYLTAAVFVSSAFGIVSSVTMLGFTVVQYFAICNPLHHQSILRKKKVRIFIGCSWMTSLIAAIVPFLVLLYIAERRPCDEDLLDIIGKVVVYGVNTCMGFITVGFIITLALCIRIFVQIRRMTNRVVHRRHDRHLMKGEKRAFVTIVILIVTLATLVIPYTIMYVLSLNSRSEAGIHSQAVIYYMNLLPYFKFLSDPLIYGLRMREFKDGCVRIGAKCGFKYCGCWKVGPLTRGPSYSLQPVHSVHSYSG